MNISNRCDRRVHVCRPLHKNFATTVREDDKFGGGSAMVCGRISFQYRTDLLIVSGILTTERF